MWQRILGGKLIDKPSTSATPDVTNYLFPLTGTYDIEASYEGTYNIKTNLTGVYETD